MTLFRRVVAAGAALLVLAQAQAALAAPALWAVRDRDSTIYLFGTMHVLSPTTQWRTPEYDEALARSSVVWFETDLSTSPDVMGRLMVKYGFDMKRPLKDKISPEAMTRLRRAMRGFPGGTRMVEFMQPWLAATLVQSIPATRQGVTGANGADVVINRDLTTASQTMRFFETIENHIRIMADLPQDVQIQMLEDAMVGSPEALDDTASEEVLDLGESAWVNGDVQLYGAAIAIAMRDSRPAFYDALLRRRNLSWVVTLSREMRGSGVQMVNVGALHLVGEDGLVALMRRRGYVVERIQ